MACTLSPSSLRGRCRRGSWSSPLSAAAVAALLGAVLVLVVLVLVVTFAARVLVAAVTPLVDC